MIFGFDHFTPVALVNDLVAQKLVRNQPFTLSPEEVNSGLKAQFPPVVVEASDGWSITIPTGFIERSSDESPTLRVFEIGGTMVITVSLKKDLAVTCSRSDVVPAPGRRGECFQRVARADDGANMVEFTAQRGAAMFMTVSVPTHLEAMALEELGVVLNSARAAR